MRQAYHTINYSDNFSTDIFSLSFSLMLQQNEAKEEEEGGTKDLSAEEVWSRIEEYNAQVSENGMTLVSFEAGDWADSHLSNNEN